ncbi:unnamed protein product [Clonostachys solani]|uniref:Nephrocystin 3-like N-terminal domain-containing protein n=1 Tax=Clonostachys solani TaxID=160281 RepID=A0A9P0ERE7_9HYPO|nr:unnamed protein product [Clonostachys solani]
MCLSGKAGTGKSSISRTVATSIECAVYFGASLFFEIGESHRPSLSKFFTIITTDLILKFPRVRRYVKSATEDEPDIFQKPLLDSQSSHSLHPIVIVVDALDECERDEDMKLFIALFTKASISQLPNCKIFLTSRAKLPIRLSFNLAAPKIFHALTTEINASDSAEGQTLTLDWTRREKIQSLAEMSIPHFIFAANPETVFEVGTKSQNPHYEKTYLSVLNMLVAELSEKGVRPQCNDCSAFPSGTFYSILIWRRVHFWVNKEKEHARSLVLRGKTSKYDICGMGDFTTLRQAFEKPTISDHLSPEVQCFYSYWLHCFEHAGAILEDDRQVHHFLQVHLLHWLEAISLLDKVYGCVGFVETLRGLTCPENSNEMVELLDDFCCSMSLPSIHFPFSYTCPCLHSPQQTTSYERCTRERWRGGYHFIRRQKPLVEIACRRLKDAPAERKRLQFLATS